MHGDRRPSRPLVPLLACVAFVLVPAAPAAAEGVYGSIQVQYQNTDQFAFTTAPDGTRYASRARNELFVQNYDVNHRDYPGGNVLLQSSLRVSQFGYRHREDNSFVPQGSMRLLHPWMNFYGSYQVNQQRSVVSTGVIENGSDVFHTLDVRQRETQFVGHIAPPRLPELDLTWLKRSRDGFEGSPGENGLQRSARLSFTRDRFQAYGGVTDQTYERSTATLATRQRTANAGSSLQLAPTRTTGLELHYDVNDVQSGIVGARSATTLNQVGQARADWRPARAWTSVLDWQWRRTDTPQQFGPRDDHEGTFTSVWTPVRGLQTTVAAGARTTPLLLDQRWTEYASLILAGDGRIRPHWQANASLATTGNWDPLRGDYLVNTLTGFTQMDLSTRARVEGTLQMTQNGDTAAVDQRLANTWMLRFVATPLRSFTATLVERSYRVGRGLLEPTGISHFHGFEFTWHPIPQADLTSTFATNGLMPNNTPKLTTRTVNARYTPNGVLQLTASWSQSSQDRAATGYAVQGREFVSGRAQITFSRRFVASVGGTAADPKSSQSSKLYDATLTWSFGR